jgi:hypothetical protein
MSKLRSCRLESPSVDGRKIVAHGVSRGIYAVRPSAQAPEGATETSSHGVFLMAATITTGSAKVFRPAGARSHRERLTHGSRHGLQSIAPDGAAGHGKGSASQPMSRGSGNND